MADIFPFDEKKPMTSGYGPREYWLGEKLVKDFHRGCDYGYLNGTPGRMMFDGTLDTYTDSSGAMYCVQIKKGTNFRVDIIHVGEILKPIGREYKQGEFVFKSGATGRNLTGAHAHFEIRPDWKNRPNDYIDPTEYLNSLQPYKPAPPVESEVDKLKKQINEKDTTIKNLQTKLKDLLENETKLENLLKQNESLLNIAVTEREDALNRALIAEGQLKDKDEGIKLLKLRIKALEAEAEKNIIEKVINYIFNLFNKKNNGGNKRSSEGTTESDPNSSNTGSN